MKVTPGALDETLTFPDQIKLLRRRKGLSQEKLAEVSGLSVSVVSKIEQGRYASSPSIVRRLASGLGVSSEERAELQRRAEDVALLPSAISVASTGPQTPYIGLKTFQERDAERFFGRRHHIVEMIDFLQRTQGLAIVGGSGSGKSSLVRAGLLPTLKQADSQQSDRITINGEKWLVLPVMTPSPRPLAALADTLIEYLAVDSDQSWLTLPSQLYKDDQLALRLIEHITRQQSLSRVLLVVDQWEEVWAYEPSDVAERTSHGEARSLAVGMTSDDPDQEAPALGATFYTEQHAFVAAIAKAACAPESPLVLVITLRADFLARATEDPLLTKWLREHLIILGPMDRDDLREVITEPAVLTGHSFEPGLVDELLNRTINRPGSLPLLEYTLLELWRTRKNRTFCWADYRAIGGVEGALASRAEALLEQYGLEEREHVRLLLLQMVQVSEGSPDTRCWLRLDQVQLPGVDDITARRMLQPLIEARLLTSSADESYGDITLGLAHEALISAWPTLARWIDESREDRRIQRKLLDAAREWQMHEQRTDFLWLGTRLRDIDAGVQHTRVLIPTNVHTFLDACRKEEQHQEQLRAEAAEREIERERLRAEVAERELERERLRAEVAEREIERERLRAELSDKERQQEQEHAAITKRELDLTKRARRRLQLAVALLGMLLLLSIGAGVIFARGEIRRLQAMRSVLLVELPGRSVAFERYEVTNQRYNLCVQAGTCRQPSNSWYESAADAALPVTHVNYYDAAQFCSWIGRRLPTRDEWEYAVTSGGHMELPQHENLFNLLPSGASEPAFKPAAVGSFASATSEGIFDLIGNVWEWMNTKAPLPDDAAAATSPDMEVMDGYAAGGSFTSSLEGFQNQQGIWLLSRSTVLDDLGFRCVEDRR